MLEDLLKKILEDLIWTSLLALYLTGLIGSIVYLIRHPTDSDSKPWARNPGEALLMTVFLVAWPALLLFMRAGRRRS